jgi:hypothetical protein
VTANERNTIRAAIDRARRAQILTENRRRNHGTHGLAAVAYDGAKGDGWEALAAAVAVRRLMQEAMQ